MYTASEIPGRILDTAMALAEQSSWEAVRLHELADKLMIPLDQVRLYYREKEDLVEAWFDRADAAALQSTSDPKFKQAAPSQRLSEVMMAWYRALGSHRSVTRQMVFGKFEPGHLHYQWAGILRVSRTVQWFREAAGRTTTLPWRALEEAALTSVYLAGFTVWMYDDSPNSARTQAFLDRRFSHGQTLLDWCRCRRDSPQSSRTPEQDSTPGRTE